MEETITMSTIAALAKPVRDQLSLPRRLYGAPAGAPVALTARRIVQGDRGPGRDGQRPATLDPEHPLMGPHPTE